MFTLRRGGPNDARVEPGATCSPPDRAVTIVLGDVTLHSDPDGIDLTVTGTIDGAPYRLAFVDALDTTQHPPAAADRTNVPGRMEVLTPMLASPAAVTYVRALLEALEQPGESRDLYASYVDPPTEELVALERLRKFGMFGQYPHMAAMSVSFGHGASFRIPLGERPNETSPFVQIQIHAVPSATTYSVDGHDLPGIDFSFDLHASIPGRSEVLDAHVAVPSPAPAEMPAFDPPTGGRHPEEAFYEWLFTHARTALETGTEAMFFRPDPPT